MARCVREDVREGEGGLRCLADRQGVGIVRRRTSCRAANSFRNAATVLRLVEAGPSRSPARLVSQRPPDGA